MTQQLTKEKFISDIFDYENNQEWSYKGDLPCIIDFYADWCQPCKIVSPVLEDRALLLLETAVAKEGRILMAGTPGIYAAGFTDATDQILEYMTLPGVRSAVLGGDTAAEVNFKGTTSTGGGSALYYLVNGTTPVYEALKKNKQNFE